jgi:hypothetical protein
MTKLLLKLNCSPRLWQALLKQFWPTEFLGLNIAEGLAQILKDHSNLPNSEESPVFILSAGWRSGSTLLQRLINSNAEVLVWGEAYEDFFLIYHMLAPIVRLTKKPLYLDFVPEKSIYPPDQVAHALTTKWIANLSPSVACLKAANLAYFDTLFKPTATKIGRPRWGLKMVRASALVATYLKWLYPNAKLVYLFRNPYDAYRSYAESTKIPWYLYYPTHPINGVIPFVVHWRHCMEGMLHSFNELDAFMISYESLTDQHSIVQLQEYLQLELDPRVVNLNVDIKRSSVSDNKRRLTSLERAAIRFIAGDIAVKQGYLGETLSPKRNAP